MILQIIYFTNENIRTVRKVKQHGMATPLVSDRSTIQIQRAFLHSPYPSSCCILAYWIAVLAFYVLQKYLANIYCVFIPSGLVGKESACNAGDPSLIPGSGRSSGEGNGSPLQYACLENPMGRGARQVTVHVIAESDTTVWLTFKFHLS